MRKYRKVRQKERKGGNFSARAQEKYRKVNVQKEKLEIFARGTEKIQEI